MHFNWIVMFVLFGIVQSFFVLYIFFSKNNNKEHTYFVWLICTLLFVQMESFLVRSGLIKYILHLFKISIPTVFLIGPFLYEYVSNQFERRASKKIVFQLLPFVLYFIYSFNFFLQSSPYKFNVIANNFHPDWKLLPVFQLSASDPLNIQGFVVVEILSAHFLLYCILTFIKLFKNKSALSIEKYNWLLYITGILTFGSLILFFSQGGIINGKVFLETPFPYYSADLFSATAMYLIMGYVLVNPEFLNGKNKKYSKSSLSIKYKKEKLHKLKTVIEKDLLYLDSNFSMKMLAEKSGLSIHHISQILNEELKCSFFQLTNKYRINEAKKRLRTTEYIKIEQLAYELGYKSKSTFFTAFKKATLVTPLQYKINKQ